jgi:4-amino-4-deoxy-L-arabinose transferase-like glycosyltransferase
MELGMLPSAHFLPARPGRFGTHATVAVLLLLGLTVFFSRFWEADLYDDGLLYATISREMARGGDWMTPHWGVDPYFKKPPLVFWLTAANIRCFGWSVAAAVFWSRALAVVAVLLTYLLARRWFSEWHAVLAAIVLATTARFLKDSFTLRLDSPLTAFWLGAWLAAFTACDRRPRLHLLAGLCTALAVLTKGPLGLLGLAPYPFLLWARRAEGGERVWWRSIHVWTGGAIALALPALWYADMVARHGARFLSVAWVSEGVDRMLRNFGEETRFAYLRMMAMYYWPWLPFLAVGIVLYVREVRKRGRWEGVYLGIFAAGYLVLISWVQTKYYRYFQPLYPLFAMLVALPLAHLVPERRRTAVLRWTAIVAGICALALNLLPLTLHRQRNAGWAGAAASLTPRSDETLAVSPGAADASMLTALWFYSGAPPRELRPHFFSAPPPDGRCLRLVFFPTEREALAATFDLAEEGSLQNERLIYRFARACRATPAERDDVPGRGDPDPPPSP